MIPLPADQKSSIDGECIFHTLIHGGDAIGKLNRFSIVILQVG